jgi:hypothetical protein
MPYHDLYTYPRSEEGVVRKFRGREEGEREKEDT